VDFDRGRTVFQLVFFFDREIRQFALLAHRNKAQIQLIRDHRAQNEATRIHARHIIEARIHIAVHIHIHQEAKGFLVLQQGRDVAKLHPGLRPVRHGADAILDVIGVQGFAHH